MRNLKKFHSIQTSERRKNAKETKTVFQTRLEAAPCLFLPEVWDFNMHVDGH